MLSFTEVLLDKLIVLLDKLMFFQYTLYIIRRAEWELNPQNSDWRSDELTISLSALYFYGR